MKKCVLVFGIILLGVLFYLVYSPCSSCVSPYTYNDAVVVIGDTSIFVEVADTREKQIQGLSGQKKLEEGQGVWFSFPNATLRGFWMKDMLFPIDIVWFNVEKQVVHIHENVSPDSYPQTFTPSTPVQYVLEVPALSSKAQGIKIGDTATITPLLR